MRDFLETLVLVVAGAFFALCGLGLAVLALVYEIGRILLPFVVVGFLIWLILGL